MDVLRISEVLKKYRIDINRPYPGTGFENTLSSPTSELEGNPQALSPLQEAVARSDIEAVEILLQLGAKVNYQNSSKSTALHIAASIPPNKISLNIVKLLIEAGANPNVREMDGETPISISQKAGLDGLVSILNRAKAERSASSDRQI